MNSNPPCIITQAFHINLSTNHKPHGTGASSLFVIALYPNPTQTFRANLIDVVLFAGSNSTPQINKHARQDRNTRDETSSGPQ